MILRSTCVLALAVVSLTACNPAQRAKEAKEDVDSGNAAACAQERSTIETAVEAYTLLTAGAAVTEAAMVAGGFIHVESVLMDIGPGGTVVAAPGSVCA
jgi:hypothetical protein